MEMESQVLDFKNKVSLCYYHEADEWKGDMTSTILFEEKQGIGSIFDPC